MELLALYAALRAAETQVGRALEAYYASKNPETAAALRAAAEQMEAAKKRLPESLRQVDRRTGLG